MKGLVQHYILCSCDSFSNSVVHGRWMVSSILVKRYDFIRENRSNYFQANDNTINAVQALVAPISFHTHQSHQCINYK